MPKYQFWAEILILFYCFVGIEKPTSDTDGAEKNCSEKVGGH